MGVPDLRADPVSRAKPLDPDWRSLHYLGYEGEDGETRWRPRMTPRQRRRWAHKLHKTGEPWPRDGKKAGLPTPRRADARRARLEARRG